MLLPALALPAARPPKRRYRHEEQRLQGAIVRCLLLAGFEAMAINIELPMGGEAGKRAGAMRKRAGARKGTPDIVVALDGGRSGWLEVKLPAAPQAVLPKLGLRRRQATTTTDEQNELHRRLIRLGHPVAVVRGIDEALDAVRQWKQGELTA